MNVISAIEKNVCGNKKSTISHIRNFIVADIGHKGMKKGGWPMRYKDIEGYEGMYGVTEHGDVFAYTRMRISKNNVPQIVWEHPIKKVEGRSGYERVGLYKNGQRKMFLVHRLVANAFLSNPGKLPQVNHKDMNTTNNHVENLEYVTCRENQIWSSKMKTHSSRFVGVYYHKVTGKWEAQYQVGKKKYHFGTHATQEEAHEAYIKGVEQLCRR
jgi:hypothetical protein